MKKTMIGFSLLLLGMFLFSSSCFQLRMSDKRQLKELRRAGYSGETGKKQGIEREIHYTLNCPDSSMPLAVFVHGSPGSGSNFLDYAKDSNLLNYYQVLLLDRPGFGYSNFGKAQPDIEQQAKELLNVIRTFNAQKIVLIGHSLGGPIICRMAMEDPELISGLVIIAGSVSPELEPEEKWRKPMSSKWLRWMLPTSFRVSNEEIIPVKAQLERMDSLWKRITCPVTIIQGEKDQLVPPENADYAKEKLTGTEVRLILLPKANHFIPFKQMGLVTEAILELPID